nr:SDR family NAD(P)-dependent oxidoreductase [Kribbella shirazensis]
MGAALVARFVADGHQVLGTDVSEDGPGGTAYRKLDVRSPEDWDAAVAWCEETWGGLDILVNNAGIATGGRIEVETLDEWDRVVDINLMGVVRGCRAFVPLFKRQRAGYIVNTASAAGLVHPPMMSSYNTVKAGVVALSETLSHELGPYGVNVSVVCPSFFRTNLADSIRGADRAMGATARQLIEKSPRTADDIAAAVVAGINKKQHLIIPDRPTRAAYWTKRLARPLYDRQMRRIAARAHEKAERASGAARAAGAETRSPDGR